MWSSWASGGDPGLHGGYPGECDRVVAGGAVERAWWSERASAKVVEDSERADSRDHHPLAERPGHRFSVVEERAPASVSKPLGSPGDLPLVFEHCSSRLFRVGSPARRTLPGVPDSERGRHDLPTRPSGPILTGHPVLRFAHQLTARLEQVAASPVWSMSPDEQREALRELARAEAQLAALRLRVLAEAERSGAGGERGAPSAADWVAIETRQTRIDARSDLKLATALERYPLLVGRDGCRGGEHRPGAGDRDRPRPAPHQRRVRSQRRAARASRAAPGRPRRPITTRKHSRCSAGGCSR